MWPRLACPFCAISPEVDRGGDRRWSQVERKRRAESGSTSRNQAWGVTADCWLAKYGPPLFGGSKILQLDCLILSI